MTNGDKIRAFFKDHPAIDISKFLREGEDMPSRRGFDYILAGSEARQSTFDKMYPTMVKYGYDLWWRLQVVKKWLSDHDIKYYYSEFYTKHYPDFTDYTRLRNVIAGRTADEEIVENLEKAIERY